MAYLDARHWGTQVNFTYGPFGFLASGAQYIFFRTWVIALAVNVAVHIGFIVALVVFLRTVHAGWMWWLLVGAVLLLPFARIPGLEYESTVIAVIAFYLASVVPPSRGGKASAVLGGVVIGCLLVTKGTAIVAGAALVGALAILNLERGRRSLLAFAVIPMSLTLLVAWAVAGQSVIDLWPYFDSSRVIISGYSAAMSTFGFAPGAEIPLLALAVAILSLTILAVGVAVLRRDRRLTAICCLVLPLSFLSFKEGFVRFDIVHLNNYLLLTILLQMLLLLTAVSAPSRNKLRLLVLPPTASLAILLAVAQLVGGQTATGQVFSMSDTLQSYRVAGMLLTNPDQRRMVEAQTIADIKQRTPLPDGLVGRLAGRTVDVVPFEIDRAYAYDLNYAPRPIMQSYSAYDLRLDAMDAQFFGSDAAPQAVVFSMDAIDHRYALADEPQMFRVLLDSYQSQGVFGGEVLLTRRGNPGAPRLEDASTVLAGIGDFVDVPPGPGVMYAKITTDPNVLGRFWNLIYKPAPLYLRLRYGDGQLSIPHRFIGATGQGGVFMSTYVTDVHDLDLAWHGQFNRPITGLQITSSDAGQYARDYRVVFVRDLTASQLLKGP